MYRDQWRWELHVQALRAIKDGQVVDYLDYLLGSGNSYDSEAESLNAWQGGFIDIPLAQNGSLIFWIYDINAIDNAGSLSFNIANISPVPEPSTLMLLAAGGCLVSSQRGGSGKIL